MQNSTIIWLVRHGETDRTSAGRFNGRDDVPLNEAGRWQCTRLAMLLANVPLEFVVTSPLARAIETAQIATMDRSLALMQDASLIEIDYGAWEGLTHREVQQWWPSQFKEWETDPAQHAPPNGESGIAVAERARLALADWVMQHNGHSILLVAHKTVNRLLLCTLLDLPLSSYRQAIPQAPCALTRLEFIEDARVLVTLPGGAQPMSITLSHRWPTNQKDSPRCKALRG